MFLSFVCLRPVSCVPNMVSVPGLSILDCPSVFSNIYVLCILFQIIALSIIMMFARLYVRIRILLISGKHLYDRILH